MEMHSGTIASYQEGQRAAAEHLLRHAEGRHSLDTKPNPQAVPAMGPVDLVLSELVDTVRAQAIVLDQLEARLGVVLRPVGPAEEMVEDWAPSCELESALQGVRFSALANLRAMQRLTDRLAI